MSQCGRLFRTDSVHAYYAAAEKHVVVTADVWLNPYADQVHLCPNPIAMPATHELLVEGTSKPGIHPQLVVKHRVSYAFASDQTPKSVVVWAMGADAPSRQEVAVDSAPPPPLVVASDPSPAPSAAKKPHGELEVIGFSASFSFDEAIHDATAQALAKLPSPPRNPDVGISLDIKDISVRAGGNIRPGLIVRAIAK